MCYLQPSFRSKSAIGKSIKNNESLITKNSINIHNNLQQEAIVSADILLLEMILDNLISNAIKYNKTDGNIYISWNSSAGGGLADALFGGISARRNWKYKQKEMALQQQYALEQMSKSAEFQLAHDKQMFDYQNAYNDPSAVLAATMRIERIDFCSFVILLCMMIYR